MADKEPSLAKQSLDKKPVLQQIASALSPADHRNVGFFLLFGHPLGFGYGIIVLFY